MNTKEICLDNYFIKAGALFKVTSISATKINSTTNPGDLTDISLSSAAAVLAAGFVLSNGKYVCPHANYISIDANFEALWISMVRNPLPSLHYIQNTVLSLTKQALVVNEEALKDAILGTDLAIPVVTKGAVTSTTFACSWVAIPHATGYKVSIDGGTTYGEAQVGTTYTKSDAIATTEYSIKVVAVAASGSGYRDSYESTALAITTLTPLAAPVLTAGTITATSFALSWVAIAHAVGYKVSIDGGTTYGETQEGVSFTKEDATAATTYSVKVKAIAEDGTIYETSPASDALSIETLAS